VLARHGLPVALGLNINNRWLVPGVFPVLYVGGAAIVVIALTRRRPVPWLLVVAAIAFPFLWGAFPVSGVIGEGRYVLFVLPVVVLLIFSAARAPVVQVLLLVAALGVSADGVHRIRCCTEPFAPDVAMPQRTQPLIAALDAHHVTRVDGDYWIVYRVAFETHERIIGSPLVNTRWPPYDRAVSTARDPAAVFVARSAFVPLYRRGLERLHVSFATYRAGEFVVYQPARTVRVEDAVTAGRA
jgi:hypothetical protein